MKNTASKVMWAGRTKNALAFAMAIGAVLATSLLVLAAAARPAEAAFPGTNGKIVYSSNRGQDGSTDYEIYVMNSDGTARTQLTNNTVNDREPTFSADGSRIAYSNNGRIWVMNADGSGQVSLMSGHGSSGSDPTFSPDGSKIAFTSNRTAPDNTTDSEIYVLNADGSGTPTLLTNNTRLDASPAFSPNGRKIAFISDRTALDGTSEEDIWVMNADGTNQANLINNNRELRNFSPSWSPDGAKIAFMSDRPDEFPSTFREREIWTINADGSNEARFTDSRYSSSGDRTPGDQARPTFSPDGEQIAFFDEDTGDVWAMNADRSGTPTNLSNVQRDIQDEPDWGPLNFDLSLVQSDSPDPVKVNNNLTYTLEVKNEGFDAAPGVVLTDRLPTGVTFVSASTGCTHSFGKVSCNLGNVAKGATTTTTIVVGPTAQDIITNTTSVESSAQEVTYTANNSDRERTEVALNRTPVANDDSYVTKEDTPLTVAAPGVLSDDTDADADSLQVGGVVETTSGGTLTLNANGSFTYTPNDNSNGADAFTYKATDGTAQSDLATATIVVRAVNDAPNAQDDSAQTEKDTPLDINVLANDRDPERDEISISTVSDPNHGTATLNADGTVRYAPDAGYTGSDPFTYTVSDSNSATDTATVNITVSDTIAPEAPVITSPADNSFDTDGSFTISGTAEPSTWIALSDGGNDLNEVKIVSESGNWSFTLSNVSEGSHSYKAKAMDLNGNISAQSEARTVMVDKTASGAPLITSPAEGASLNVRSLTLSGTAEAGAKVELFEGEVSKGEATAGSGGAWSIDLTGVSDGSHSYTAKATDEAGNTSAQSEARSVVVDGTAPSVRRVVPRENTTGIAPRANVSALFSEAMDTTSVTQVTFKVYQKGSRTALAATVTYDAAKKKAVLNPTANLQRGATYKAVITTEAKDLAGNQLGQPKVWFFTITP